MSVSALQSFSGFRNKGRCWRFSQSSFEPINIIVEETNNKITFSVYLAPWLSLWWHWSKNYLSFKHFLWQLFTKCSTQQVKHSKHLFRQNSRSVSGFFKEIFFVLQTPLAYQKITLLYICSLNSKRVSIRN